MGQAFPYGIYSHILAIKREHTILNNIKPIMAIGLVTFLSSLFASEPVDFALPDLDGGEHRLSDYRGKWVLVNYWATWCPPCLEEMPELEIFHDKHKDTDAVVIGVNMEDIEPEHLRRFLNDQFVSYPILLSKPMPRTELGTIPGLPTSYLVSPQGIAVARQVGALTAQDLEDYIDRFQKAHPKASEKNQYASPP